MENRSWNASDRNIGDCRQVSWDEMWQRFRIVYGRDYREHELKQMHDRWRRLTAEVCGI